MMIRDEYLQRRVVILTRISLGDMRNVQGFPQKCLV